MADKENLHKDHRSRLRHRYELEGFANFEDHNVLELLLFYAIPRKDTNPIAHRLINRFGSLHAVLEASEKELCEVEGIGPSAASFLRMCPQIAKRVEMEKLESNPFITGTRLGQYFVNVFRFTSIEAACILFLDDDLRYVSLDMIQNSTLDAPYDVVDKTVAIAKRRKASYAVLSHNHGDVGTVPSSMDLASTADIKDELEALGIHLIAHYIVSGYDYANFMKETDFGKGFRYDL